MKKKWLKRLTALLTISAMTASLAGCASSGNASSSSNETQQNADVSADTQTEAVETIRIGRSTGNIRVAILTLADELGYYNEEGVNVEFVEISDASAAISAISLNKDEIDVLQTAGAGALSYIAQGTNVEVIGGIASEGGAMITLPENKEYYSDLSNLKGGITVATLMTDTGGIITRNLLEEKGIDTNKEINYLYLSSAQNVIEAVLKGEAEVGFANSEAAHKYLDMGISIVYEVGDLVPDYVCCRQISSKEKVEAKRDAFVKKAVAEIRAYEYYSQEENHDNCVSILAKQSGQEEDYVRAYIYENTKYTLDPNINGLQDLFNTLLLGNYIENVTVREIADSVDVTIYQDALAILRQREPENEFYKNLEEQFERNNF
jgi:NitT/TauT family transport system substrate-binding protein